MKTLYEHMKSLGYPNIQKAVNSGPRETINPRILKIVTDFQEREGWFEITLDEIMMVNPGDRIRYITNSNPPDPKSAERTVENDKYPMSFKHAPRNKFRTGGWVISVDLVNRYILYRTHVTGCCPQSIQFDYIARLFYLPRDGSASSGSKPTKYRMPETVTNYPVMLKDRDGNDVVVYYAPSKSKQEKFMMTQKFENAMRNGFEFI
jgi:hypothetical protein